MVLSELHREEVIFSGHVQGVGFRYSTLQVAKEFEVAGTVANLPDGRVRLVAEGKTSEVTAFVKAVEERMYGHIRKIERKPVGFGPRFVGFTIS